MTCQTDYASSTVYTKINYENVWKELVQYLDLEYGFILIVCRTDGPMFNKNHFDYYSTSITLFANIISEFTDSLPDLEQIKQYAIQQ